ncbi:hypothetical protein D915_004373 [Fasciola hepatica]|uniref:Uncharacterized protein n=1 Tax=Fasciola hepatica TaxID=6192 RepID=A0A4E0S1K5_FASHE|nr:hypothetical protein D915_004373 [Fasciola hepatica]
MTFSESQSLVSFFCCDTVVLVATVFTVLLLLLTYYFKGRYSNDFPGQISRSPEETSVPRKTTSPERDVSGDVPRRTSGRRRRREDNTASPRSPHQQMLPSCPSQVHSVATPIVAPTETDPKAKFRSSSTDVREQTTVSKPVVHIKQSVHSSLSKSDEVLHSTKKSPVSTKSTVESSPMTLAAVPLNSSVPISPKQPVATVTAESAGEWRDVTPRRRERRRSRHSSKQSESGTPVSSVKQNFRPPSEIPVPARAAVDPVVESQAFNTTQPREPFSTSVPRQSCLELDTSSKMEKEMGPHSQMVSLESQTLSNEPDEPDPGKSQGKSSKPTKAKRKRRGVAAPKPDVVPEPNSPHPPSSLSLSTESIGNHQRATPDDSEFEMVDISGHQTVIIPATESDPDNSLGTDWSLAQPIPQTGDIHEFPCLPGTESQFAIVQPSGSDDHLECGQHPLAKCLLSSALNDLVEEDSTANRRDSKLPPEVTTTTDTAHVPTTKTTVKRSKARKAD